MLLFCCMFLALLLLLLLLRLALLAAWLLAVLCWRLALAFTLARGRRGIASLSALKGSADELLRIQSSLLLLLRWLACFVILLLLLVRGNAEDSGVVWPLLPVLSAVRHNLAILCQRL
jgi:hypothetical protein